MKQRRRKGSSPLQPLYATGNHPVIIIFVDDHKTDPDQNPPVSTVAKANATAAMTAVVNTIHLEHGADAAHSPTLTGFELLDPVGRGGMGIVYRAKDLSLNRDVAIKILKDGFAPDSSLSARFTDEARITGQLQHPAIPAVHQVGRLSDGRPYLVMKLIKGRTLDQLLRERPDVGHDRGRFIAVFEAVCQAVGYAHAHDVIHRDLKPHNIMVGAFGETQVMDWGLAKVMTEPESSLPKKPADDSRTRIHAPRASDSSQTQAGSIMGTPAYMAPEQAAGEIARIGPRADVFGLGAILCVILTGKPPYVGDDFDEVRLKALRGHVAEAYGWLDQCGAEAEWIALAKRCLSPAMEERPADAGKVAEAVATLRTEAEQRVRQAEIEKARLEVQAIETRKRRRVQILLAAAAAGILLMTIAGFLWSRMQAAAHEAGLRAERERVDYEITSKLEQAEAALRKPNYSIVEIDVLLNHVDEKMKTSGQEDHRRRHEAALVHRKMLEVLDVIDDKRWSLDDTNLSVNVDLAKNQYPKAFQSWGVDVTKDAVSTAASEIANSPISQRLITALYAWAEVESPPQVFDILNRLDPDPQRTAVRSAYAAKDNPKIAQLTSQLDGRSLPIPFAQFVGGHPLTPRDQAIRILSDAQYVHPDQFGLISVLALRYPRDRFSNQVTFARAAVALRPNNPNCHNNLGVALDRSGETDGAIVCYLNALAINPNMLLARYNLGLGKLAKKDYDGAIADLREAIRLDPKYPFARNALGNALRDKGDSDAAVKEFREAIRLDANYAEPHANWAGILAKSNKPDEALAEYRIAVKINPNLAYAHYGIGLILLDRKDYDAALAEFQEAVRISPKYALAHNGIGNCHYNRKQYEPAISAYRSAIQWDPTTAVYHSNLAYALLDSGQKEAAWPSFQKAVDLRVPRDGPYVVLSLHYQEAGQHKEALKTLTAGADLLPNWAKNARNKIRYNQARNALIIAANLDDESLTETDRVKLRNDAMNWMTEELASWTEIVATDPKSKPQAHGLMKFMLVNKDLESVRDPKKLPIKERAGWTKIWKDIERIRDETAPPIEDTKTKP